MKTKEELSALKEEVENLNKKLAELTDDELKNVVGGGPKIISPLLRLPMSEPGITWIFDIGDTDPSVSGGQHQRKP